MLASAVALLALLHPVVVSLALSSASSVVARRTFLVALAAPQAKNRPPPTTEVVDRALREFNRGDYETSLASWVAVTEALPDVGLYWSNRGTMELIVGSKSATLGVRPSGGALKLLEASVASFNRAMELGEEDPVALNNRGNALSVLLRWEEAAQSYDLAVAAAAKAKQSESVAAENRAQVAFELGDAADAERRAVALLRRDPNFLDARAFLAAVRFARGDSTGAEASFADLCRPAVSAPNQFRPPTPGIGGTDFCELYATTEVVQGRWTPKSIAAYDAFLRSREKNARIAANANPFRDM